MIMYAAEVMAAASKNSACGEKWKPSLSPVEMSATPAKLSHTPNHPSVVSFSCSMEPGQERRPDRHGCDQEAGGACGDSRLSIVDCDVVEGDTDGAAQGESGKIAQFRPAKMRERGIDREHQRCDQEPKDRKMGRRIGTQSGANPCERRRP